MNRLSFFVLVLLSAAFLGLLAPYIAQPALYTLQDDPATSFHANPAALEQISQRRSAELESLMQGLLDSPQPVVLNVRIHDFEEAQRAFDEYKEKSRTFGNIVVSLELSKSAVGDFQRENRKNLAALERMINESARFAEINRLEIRYRSEDNPTLLYTLTYEGEAVQQALADASGELAGRKPEILDVSGKLGLNTTRYLEAVDILDEIVSESRQEQEVRAGNQPVINESSLMLAVTPASGRYGDALQVAGAYTFTRLAHVTLVLDGRDWKSLATNEGGVFTTPLPIGRIRAGDHVIFASSGPLYSNIVTFTVLPAETTITLETEPGETWDHVLCSGSLYAGKTPVRSAPVRIMVDDFLEQTVTVSDDGTYSAIVVLAEGGHTLRAVFDDPGYPLLPSSSGMQSVSVTPRANLSLVLLVGGGVLAGALIVAGWYPTRRRTPVPPLVPGEPARIPSVQTGLHKAPLSPIDVLIRYMELFEGKRWSEAAQVLYVSLRDRLARRAAPRLSRATTAREFAGIFSGTALSAPFRSFVARYEEIRYGASSLVKSDQLLAFWDAILSLIEEGRHE